VGLVPDDEAEADAWDVRCPVEPVLDPMHIFKNVAMTVWEHLMGVRDSLAI
jgi:hypothetical protein